MARWLRIMTITALLLCVDVFGNDTDAATAAQSGVPGVWRQLAGPAVGTQVADFDASCPPTGPFNTRLRHQFDITVAGGPAVGTVSVAMDTCVRVVGLVSFWDGSFVLRTRLGDISGSASGGVTEVIPPNVRTIFTLTPTSGTGALGHNFVPLTLELIFNVPGIPAVAPADGTLSVGRP
jgi:hypothetical protein